MDEVSINDSSLEDEEDIIMGIPQKHLLDDFFGDQEKGYAIKLNKMIEKFQDGMYEQTVFNSKRENLPLIESKLEERIYTTQILSKLYPGYAHKLKQECNQTRIKYHLKA